MGGSASEREIRDYGADRLRQMLPGTRIIHELVVGGCRADLAAIQPERITLVEIKSEKDTLKRLPTQVEHFSRAAHSVIVIAHEKWWDNSPYKTGHARFVPGKELLDGSRLAETWAYPESDDRPNYGAWRFTNNWSPQPEPRASEMLLLLWRAELMTEAKRHRIVCSSRATMMWLVREMSWLMTGREIAQAVCRQLRQRPFPEADQPISEDRIAA